MDYFGARYYSSAQGRFTSPDEFKGGPEELFGEVDPHDPLFYADIADPQSLNKYQYCLNNPLHYIDPDGHQTTTSDRVMAAAREVGGIARRTLNGAASALSEDNGFGPMNAPQNKVGRAIGHALALGQGIAEIAAGVTTMATGGAMVVASDGTLSGPGIAVAQAGAVVTAYGGAVLLNTYRNVTSDGSSSQNGTAEPKQSKLQKSETTREIGGGKFTEKRTIKPGNGPGQSRAELVRIRNSEGKIIRTYKDSYDRANKFMHRKPLRGGREGRPQD